MVFQRLPANDEISDKPKVADVRVAEDKSVSPQDQGSEGGVGESSKEGVKDVRKQWGEGGGVPLVELLQHKELQTATYAVDDGKTGMHVNCIGEMFKKISHYSTHVHVPSHFSWSNKDCLQQAGGCSLASSPTTSWHQ